MITLAVLEPGLGLICICLPAAIKSAEAIFKMVQRARDIARTRRFYVLNSIEQKDKVNNARGSKKSVGDDESV